MNWKTIYAIVEEFDGTDVIETMEHIAFNVRVEIGGEEAAALTEALSNCDSDITITKTGDADARGYTPYSIALTHKDSLDWEDYKDFLRKVAR